MEPARRNKIESQFKKLPPESQTAIIAHGAALYLSILKKRVVLARAKIQQFEAKYQTSLAQLDNSGLPDDADYEMHEDYIMWHHWNDTIQKANDQVALLEKIADNTLNVNEAFHVSC